MTHNFYRKCCVALIYDESQIIEMIQNVNQNRVCIWSIHVNYLVRGDCDFCCEIYEHSITVLCSTKPNEEIN